MTQLRMSQPNKEVAANQSRLASIIKWASTAVGLICTAELIGSAIVYGNQTHWFDITAAILGSIAVATVWWLRFQAERKHNENC